MTTNVLDCVSGVLSTDSRWSISKGDWVAYVEDTNYDKLVYNHRVAFLFAGDMPQIDRWKKYIAGGLKKGTRPAQIQGTKISVIQVDVGNGKIVFQSHNFLNSTFGVSIRALFAGTGASHAKVCWDTHKCAMTAIGSAAKKDHLSGGNVIYLNRLTRAGNAANTATAEEVCELFKNRGVLMNIMNTYMPMLIKDAISDTTNVAAHAMAKSIMSGAAPLTAPFPGMDDPWSDVKMAEFDAALALYEED